jgi:hypothetical protein
MATARRGHATVTCGRVHPSVFFRHRRPMILDTEAGAAISVEPE